MIYGENRYFTTIRCANNAEWIERRKQGVGGSDVAAIMGLSPWRTPAEVWLEKTGRVEPDDISDKPYVAFGNIMEPLVGRWYSERHPDRRVRRVNAICQSIARPWAQASLDYEVMDPGCGYGVLEIKTARSAADWHDGVPLYYQTQIYHYMTVTGRTFADVAVFFRDTCEFAEWRVEYDESDANAIIGAVDDFWANYVHDDVMPAVVGTAGEASALTEYYGTAKGGIVGCDSVEAVQAIADYQSAADLEKRAKAEKTAAAAKLAAIIGENKGIETDVARVTWVRSESERFDSKRFKTEHPDLWGQYASTYVRNGGIRIKELR